MEAVLILLPACAGLGIYLHLTKHKLNYFEMAVKYGTIVSLTNIIEFGALFLNLDDKNTLFSSLTDNIGFAFKYMFSGFLLAFVIGFIIYVVEKSIDVDLDVHDTKKNGKKKSN